MDNLLIVGSQWGDEGKGKFVDIFTDVFDVVVRYQGGHNAGHTIIVDDVKYVLHLLPSGIIRPDRLCVVGNGLVVDPVALLEEMDFIEARGVELDGRLFVSDRAHLILPVHRAIERADELSRGREAIGTTLRGIGPAYSEKYFRSGIRMGAIGNADTLRREIKLYLERKKELFRPEIVDDVPEDEWDAFFRACERIRTFVTDTSLLLEQWMKDGKRILMEGAQGTMLDVDHGTYPFVTSSHATAGGACIGTGLPPHRIGAVAGVMKAYTTRVGAGPFPTELDDATGEQLRRQGGEFGASTGRPRRCGWLDLFQMKYSCRINGFHTLLMTKLDVLDGLDRIQVCVGYRLDGRMLDSIPQDVADLERVEPVYEVLPGWQAETAGVRQFEDLPAAARSYVRFVQGFLGVEIGAVSTGPGRHETVIDPSAPQIQRILAR